MKVASSGDNSDITDDENNHSNSEYKQFYSLKGNQTDVTSLLLCQ